MVKSMSAKPLRRDWVHLVFSCLRRVTSMTSLVAGVLVAVLLPYVKGDCGGVPNVDNAMPDVRSATSAAGTIATYTCNGGYIKLDGGATITCQNDDTWTQHTLRCGPINCGDPGTPDNGERSNVWHVFPNQIHFTCNSGYTMTGNSGKDYRICQATGVWTGSTPTCEPVECPELSEPRDGTISTRIHTFGIRVTFSCDETYAYTGSVTRVCESSGQWSGSEGQCIENACPYIELPYGTVSGDEGRIEYSSKYFSCFDNATIQGATESLCIGGAWDPAPPICYGKCQRPVIENGQLNGGDVVFEHNYKGSFECFGDFKVEGTSTTDCSNGTWTPPPNCVPVILLSTTLAGQRPTDPGAPHQTTPCGDSCKEDQTGLIVGIVVGVLAALLLCAAIACLLHKRAKNRRGSSDDPKASEEAGVLLNTEPITVRTSHPEKVPLTTTKTDKENSENTPKKEATTPKSQPDKDIPDKSPTATETKPEETDK